jgi:hypothetical protein
LEWNRDDCMAGSYCIMFNLVAVIFELNFFECGIDNGRHGGAIADLIDSRDGKDSVQFKFC